MQSRTFSLAFFLDKELNIGLRMTWIEGNQSVILPQKLWPENENELEEVGEIAFPLYQLKKRAAQGRQKKQEADLKRALVQAGAVVKKVLVTSKTTGKEYAIKVLGRQLTCNCPDFVFRKRKLKQHCKHISAWIETGAGKEVYEKISPPKVRQTGGVLRPRDMTLEQVEYAYKHRYELEQIITNYQFRKWLKEISSSTTKDSSNSSKESRSSPISMKEAGLKHSLRKKQKR